MSEKQSVLSRFEIIECEGDEFSAVLQIGPLCASIERTKAGYVPAFSENEWGDAVGKGQPLRTAELAAESALSLAQGYLRSMSMAFAGFTETADMVVRGDAT